VHGTYIEHQGDDANAHSDTIAVREESGKKDAGWNAGLVEAVAVGNKILAELSPGDSPISGARGWRWG
jgi:hypothetical protein